MLCWCWAIPTVACPPIRPSAGRSRLPYGSRQSLFRPARARRDQPSDCRPHQRHQHAYSTISRDYLLREGLPPDRVIKTGSPMYEVLHHYMPKIQSSDVLKRLGLQTGDFFVISAHREENIDFPDQFAKLIEVLNGLAGKYSKRVIVSTHPRTRKKMDAQKVQLNPLVELMNRWDCATMSSCRCTPGPCCLTVEPLPRKVPS